MTTQVAKYPQDMMHVFCCSSSRDSISFFVFLHLDFFLGLIHTHIFTYIVQLQSSKWSILSVVRTCVFVRAGMRALYVHARMHALSLSLSISLCHTLAHTHTQQEGPKSPDGVILLNSQFQRKTQHYVRSQGLEAMWKSFSDSTAGVFRYEYSVVADDEESIFPYLISNVASPVGSFLLERKELRHARAFRFKVLARNFASAVSEISGRDIIFDLLPPQCR